MQVYNGCKLSSDTIQVNRQVPPVVTLPTQQSICVGDSIVLNAGQGTPGDTYVWQDDSTQPTLTVTEDGVYTVDVTNECGSSTGRTTIVETQPPTVEIDFKKIFCEGSSTVLQPTVQGENLTYQWQDGSTGSDFTINQPGTYWVTVQNECGSDTDGLQVQTVDCSCNVFVPNVFSPNFDGINDDFGPEFNPIKCIFLKYNLTIANRWGGVLFQTNDPTEKWNGTFKGKQMPEGVYFYILTYQSDRSDRQNKISGSVKILK